MMILVHYISPHIDEGLPGDVVKMVFMNTEEVLDFDPPDDMQRLYLDADSIATVVADYIVRHDPENLTDDDKLSLKILYGKWRD